MENSTMSLPEPQIQFRGPSCLKEALANFASRKGLTASPFLRSFVMEGLIIAQAKYSLSTLGFKETMRRLDPSVSFGVLKSHSKKNVPNSEVSY